MNDYPGLPGRSRAAVAVAATVTALSLLTAVLLLFDSQSRIEPAAPVLAQDSCAPGTAHGADPARCAAPAAR